MCSHFQVSIYHCILLLEATFGLIQASSKSLQVLLCLCLFLSIWTIRDVYMGVTVQVMVDFSVWTFIVQPIFLSFGRGKQITETLLDKIY